ncbi:endolytic transglycosylase MltG [Streptomyces tirandamycinicus]|uniref:endolytic transglycosylase MltG n=1 Tax=Streptomyces tirandamycinicus TaxID=2174846 RepID=UPI00226F6894|nr:endolytic transglycosylase MltG [Streptomyces tirandamycinicus]MCY0984305.1 endolytic transglycosylase MltG [Streptomyces tirandamycinicus]
MTEYGRSPGSEPWHPEDPLYGDQGWRGQQGGAGPASYGGRPQQQYPQQPQDQAHQEGDQYRTGHQQHYGQDQYGQDQYGQDQYGQDQYGQDQYGQDQYGQGGYGQGQHGQGQYEPQQQYEQQQYGTGQYATGQYGAQDYAGRPYDPAWDAGGQPVMPYDPGPAPYGDGADHYGTPDAYPPPQPPGHRTEPQPPEARPSPADGDRPSERQEEDHPFFTGDDRDADEPGGTPGGTPRRGGDGRGAAKKKKGRNGFACLFVALVLVGGAGGATYVGYQFWQGQFGEAPDFDGPGSGSVQVEIALGASGTDIGSALKKAGVVKSVDAFVSAQNDNPRGTKIQDGVYTLKKGMSAEEAVKAMLDPNNRNALSIAEGARNAAIYALIDKRLELDAGTTQSVARKEAGNLGLPVWARNHENVKDPLEGFLYPATYPVAPGSRPETILKAMVARANQEYGKIDLEAKAKQLKLKNAWELITVASLVQAEGKNEDDYRKMAEVVYNRLKPTNTETNQLLQFDSAFNYLKGQSKIDISEREINSNQDPYNTYTQKGLPPGPIGNPDLTALNASITPTSDGWLYFVATDGKEKTEYARTHADFEKLKEKFNGTRGGN